MTLTVSASSTPLFVWFALCLQELPVTHTTVLFCVVSISSLLAGRGQTMFCVIKKEKMNRSKNVIKRSR